MLRVLTLLYFILLDAYTSTTKMSTEVNEEIPLLGKDSTASVIAGVRDMDIDCSPDTLQTISAK